MTETSPARPASIDDDIPKVANGRPLTQTDIEALREAKIWRAARELDKIEQEAAQEAGGADRTTDPTRYGDWEKEGRAIDFS